MRGSNDSIDAVVRVDGRSDSPLKGTGTFSIDGQTVRLNLRVTDAPPGVHAVHLHEVGDCSANDASSAGDHWNPQGGPHGHLTSPPSHLGDIGNLTVGADRTGTLDFSVTTAQWTIGTGELNDVVGKALVVHEKHDDFLTQPSGDAGDRIGCGVVQLKGTDPVAALR